LLISDTLFSVINNILTNCVKGDLKREANGKRWDVRLDYVRQFKSELVRQLEGLIFEGKKFRLG
jgi:hypothetical protein